MKIEEVIGRTLEERIAQRTLALLQQLQIRAEQTTSIQFVDPMGQIAAQILCLAGFARQESVSTDLRIARWYMITDAGKERVSDIKKTESRERLGDR